MKIESLLLLETLAENSNLSRAAIVLRTTQPRLSQQLRQLESELGFSVFERTSRGLKITEQGMVFLPFAKKIARTLAEGIAMAASQKDAVSGTLHLGLSRTTPPTTPQFLMTFRKVYPSVHVTVTKTSLPDLVLGLNSRRFEVCLCYEPEESRNLRWEPLFQSEVVAISAPALGLAAEMSLEDLSKYPLVLHSRACSTRMLLDRTLLRCNLTPNISMEIDDSNTLRIIVKSGGGISFLPQAALVSTRHLVVTRILQPKLHIAGGLLHRDDMNPAALAFSSLLRAAPKAVQSVSLESAD